ncbi:basic amino acid ABC transporter substrate-binding protein [soil metagenome]
MRPLKLPALFVVLALALFGFASCGGDDGDEEASDPSTSAEDLGLIDDATLRVCSDIPYEPFEFEGDGPSGFTGFDIDLLQAMADELELTLEVQVTPFDGILGAVAAGDCDVVASALTITEERAEQVAFTDPYFDADQSLMIKTDQASEISGLDDLAGGTIGVQTGTTGETYAEENAPDDATISSFDGADGLFGAIEADQIDAILQDFPVNAYRTTQDDTLEVVEEFETGEEYGFALAQDNDALLDALDRALGTVRDDGTYDELFEEYFGEGES